MKILIVGAGIGGLGAAIALSRHGFDVSVFEKAPELSEVGAGIQLSPNAMHVLAAYGLSKQLEQLGFQPLSGALRDYKSGKTLTETPFGSTVERRYGQKYLHVHRADLIELLKHEALQSGVSLYLDAEVKTLSQNTSSVSIELGDGRRFNADVLVGADGLKSFVRRQ